MPKYSTGGSSDGGGGGACELCGSSSDDLQPATIAGAELEVCSDCAPHGDTGGGGSGSGSGSGSRDDAETDADRRKKAARNAARLSDAWAGDSSHWEEEGTDYEQDRLPYLVPDYGERVTRARQDAGLQRDELADDLGVPENDLLAVEQGRANQADVGGSVIFALEERLDVELAEDTD
jgi:ribosome-binding protein aMBF1 (putative translation factor)